MMENVCNVMQVVYSAQKRINALVVSQVIIGIKIHVQKHVFLGQGKLQINFVPSVNILHVEIVMLQNGVQSAIIRLLNYQRQKMKDNVQINVQMGTIIQRIQIFVKNVIYQVVNHFRVLQKVMMVRFHIYIPINSINFYN